MTGHADLVEALEMAQSLIQEAKGVEGPKGGPVTDTLDAAEMWLWKVKSALSTPIAAHGAGAVTEVCPVVSDELVEQAWCSLVNMDDRTSPEEYPDMALIKFDELRDIIAGFVKLGAKQ